MPQSLFPVFEVPGFSVEQERTIPQYAQAPLWDYAAGDFVHNGSGQVVYGTGQEAWILWCIKTVLTQRWAHFAYSRSIGVESMEAFREADRAAVQSAFERTITEALLSDPARRTQQVRDFDFTWEPDALHISCEVVGADGNSAVIDASLRV